MKPPYLRRFLFLVLKVKYRIGLDLMTHFTVLILTAYRKKIAKNRRKNMGSRINLNTGNLNPIFTSSNPIHVRKDRIQRIP
jgi:hypothetical protein